MRRLTHATIALLITVVVGANLGVVGAPGAPENPVMTTAAADRTAPPVTHAAVSPPSPLEEEDEAAAVPTIEVVERMAAPALPAASEITPPFVLRRPGEPIVLDDVLHLRGRIEIDHDSLEEFAEELRRRDSTASVLSRDRFRREYLGRLQVTVRSTAARRALPHVLAIDADGTFEWRCAVPAGDFEVVLEPRRRGSFEALPARMSRTLDADEAGAHEVVFACVSEPVGAVREGY
ncbi:MAG: hypothetical protein AAF726_15830 [Planctomycetota bacterium]